VTKFEFKFDEVRTSNVSPDSKFDDCFKGFVVECEFTEKSLFYDWFHMHRQQASTGQTSFFLKFNLLHKL